MQHPDSYPKIIKYEPYFHALFWLMALLFPYIKFLGKEGGYTNTIFHELNTLFFHMVFSYFFYFVVLKSQLKWKIALGIVAALLLAGVHEFADSFFHEASFEVFTWKRLISHVISYATYGIIFYALYASKEVYHKQHELLVLHQEKQAANMAALRAQVTPHFLFNTLNTIYRKVLAKDEESAGLLLMLSDNIRYFLHEGQKDKVGLQEEIAHIENYIQLQSERWKKKLLIQFSQEGINDQIEVAPLLFIPFVENAFKYASQLRGEGQVIEISFSLKGGQLDFRCVNPYGEKIESMIEKKEDGGIGIPNVRKRLQLIYPEKHQLEVRTGEQKFIVNLTLTVC